MTKDYSEISNEELLDICASAGGTVTPSVVAEWAQGARVELLSRLEAVGEYSDYGEYFREAMQQVINQALVDTANTQSDEIDKLGQERDRYREALEKIRSYEAGQDKMARANRVLEPDAHGLVWSWANEALEGER